MLTYLIKHDYKLVFLLSLIADGKLLLRTLKISKLILNPNAGQTAQQRAEGMIQPPAPPAEVKTETAQGGPSLPTQQKDAKGNWFNVDAVARQYGQSPQQRANVRRMLPAIDKLLLLLVYRLL